MKILIYGSCVSRDIISHSQKNKLPIDLVDYYARSSLASVVARPFESSIDIQLEKILSPFQRRMVERDVNKSFFDDLDKLEYDILLVDLVDERLNIWVDDFDHVITLSSELSQTGFLNQGHIGRVVVSGNEEFWERWLQGWSLFVERLRYLGKLHKLVINKVYWSLETEAGQEFGESYPAQRILSANKLLKRMYDRIEIDVSRGQIIEFPTSLLRSADSHKWGVSPFHYIDDYYAAALENLYDILHGFCGEDALNNSLVSEVNIGCDYSAWRCIVFDAVNFDSFISNADFGDGIHRIIFKGVTLDILIQGLGSGLINGSKNCLVGFGGVVSSRSGTRPPFFSGRGVAADLGLPLIAFSDPSLALDENLPLAWYAGNRFERGMLYKIAKIIDRIAFCHDLKIVIFGGSGGGFAGLAMSHLLRCDNTVVIWNPQTDIAEYVPNYVLQYIAAAFPELRDEIKILDASEKSAKKDLIRKLLERSGVIYSLINKYPSQRSKVLYLQNIHDWHVDSHLRPYLKSFELRRISPVSFTSGENFCLHFGDWGVGHSGPPRNTISDIIAGLCDGLSVTKTSSELFGRSNEKFGCALFAADLPEPGWRPQLSYVWDKDFLSLKVGVDGLPITAGLVYAVYLLKGDERKRVLWYQTGPEFNIPKHGLDCDSARIFVRDAWKDIRIAQFSLSSEIS
jgi:hypothetical protein